MPRALSLLASSAATPLPFLLSTEEIQKPVSPMSSARNQILLWHLHSGMSEG